MKVVLFISPIGFLGPPLPRLHFYFKWQSYNKVNKIRPSQLETCSSRLLSSRPMMMMMMMMMMKESRSWIGRSRYNTKSLEGRVMVLQRIELSDTQGSVVRRPISVNPRLNFNLGFFFFCSKAFSRIIFSILFRATNHQIVRKKNKTEFPF